MKGLKKRIIGGFIVAGFTVLISVIFSIIYYLVNLRNG